MQGKTKSFLNLVECYATGKSDENTRNLIQKLYDMSMSHPFPEEWIEECLEVYRMDSLEDLHDTQWMKMIWDAADEGSSCRYEIFFPGQARRICQSRMSPYLIL